MAFSNKSLLFYFHGSRDFALAGKPSVQEDKQRISGEEMHTMISYTMASIMASNIVGGLLFINHQLITLGAIYTFIMFLIDSILV